MDTMQSPRMVRVLADLETLASAPMHPRPGMRRPLWRSLDGVWLFAFDDECRCQEPADVHFERTIVVPFSPESAASGVGDRRFHKVAWYLRRITPEPWEREGRLLLHFGAVDYASRVWANGQLVATHSGGYTPFTADITEIAHKCEVIDIVVRAEDDPHDLAKPRGKQDWLEEPHEIWYPRTTGIWGTVWLEPVPEIHIERVIWTPYLERWEIGVEVVIAGPIKQDLEIHVRLVSEEEVLADDRYAVARQDVSRRIGLADPGIDDHRNRLLWSPHNPVLIDAEVELLLGGKPVDAVKSYTALRSVGVAGNRFMLNGRPYYLRMVLDQGYWPETLLTPPDAAALLHDVKLTKMMGFNGVRKHQKIEDPRWLYFCDKLGLMVWGEMPSCYRFTPAAVQRLVEEWTQAIRRDYSHPCVIAWVPLNESWGVPDLPTNTAHRNYVRALYHMTKTLDPTRPVVGNDGWEHVATDIITIHDYAANPGVIFERYATPESVAQVLERQEPGGRALTVEALKPDQYPFIVSECGGIAIVAPCIDERDAWGYSRVTDPESFLEAYRELLAALHECRGIGGFCYTQLTDTFQEKNGLLTADRAPKVDVARIAEATRGGRRAFAMDVNPTPTSESLARRFRRRRI